MASIRRATLLLVLAMVLTIPVAAQESGPARSQLEAFSAGLESLSADFEQTVTGPDGRVESSGSGELWLARPGLFRWAYRGDFPELIVADGKRIWMYDQALEQVTVKPQSNMPEDSPLSLLTDLSVLDERFTCRELGPYEGVQLLELSHTDPEAEFERVLLGLADSQLRLMIMEDAFGLRTELRFSEIERNPSLDDKLFRFQPPHGVDVVGDTHDGT